MFDLVNKYRTPVMWLCVVLMCGFGAWILIADLFDRGDNPERELGRFTIPGGKTVAVTNYMLAEALQIPQRRGYLQPTGRGAEQGDRTPMLAQEMSFKSEDELETMWAFIVFREAARAAGIEMTDAAVVEDFNYSARRNAAQGGTPPREMTLDDWRKGREEDRKFFRDLWAIKRYRSALNTPDDTTYEKMYNRFKTDFEQLRAEYVFFDGAAKDVKIDPRASAEDRAELEKWFAEEAQRGVRAGKMVQEQGDFEVLYAGFKDLDDAAFNEKYSTIWGPKIAEAALTVTDAEVESRFNGFREAYKTAIDAGQAADSRESRPARNDFEAAKERVKNELLVVKLAELLHKQLGQPGFALSFEQLATPYGFKSTTVMKADSEAVVKQSEFGSAAAQAAIFSGFADQKLKPGDLLNVTDEGLGAKGPVDDPARSVSIWRVLAKRDAREPTLDDPGVIDYAVEKYVEKKKQEEAKKQADEFKKTLDERLTAALKDREAALDAEMKAAVDDEITKAGLTRDKVEDRPKVLQLENAERVKRNEKLEALKAEQEPGLFKALAEEKGLPIKDTGWVRRNVGGRGAQLKPDDVKLSTEEKAARFFRKPQRMNALAALKKGRVGQVENEPVVAAAAILRLVDRREPTPAEMWSLSEQQLTQLKRTVNPAPPVEWSYETLKSPAWFALDAPDLARAIEERAKQRAQAAETERKSLEKKKQQAMKKAATHVEAMRDPTSPIKSGDDW
jgi:hypothetical protein